MKNALWVFALAVIVLIFFLPSYSKMQDLRQKNINYARDIEALRQENERFRQEQFRLEKDPVYLEKVAREKMGIVKDGEVVYKIVPGNKEE